MDNQVNVTHQRAVLKTLSKNVQHEIEINYKEGNFVSELCKDSQHLTESNNK